MAIIPPYKPDPEETDPASPPKRAKTDPPEAQREINRAALIALGSRMTVIEGRISRLEDALVRIEGLLEVLVARGSDDS